MQIAGKVLQVFPTRTIQSRDGQKTFMTRTLVLDTTRFDPYTGERGYDNFPSFEFGGERCAELDGLQPGMLVKVSFDLNGVRYEKDGQVQFFTRVRGYKVEPMQLHQATTQPQQQSPQVAPVFAAPQQQSPQVAPVFAAPQQQATQVAPVFAAPQQMAQPQQVAQPRDMMQQYAQAHPIPQPGNDLPF